MADTGNQNQDENAAQASPANSQPITVDRANIGDVYGHQGPIQHVYGDVHVYGQQPGSEEAFDSLSDKAALWQEKSQEAADKIIGTLPSNPVPLDIIRDSQAPLEEFGLKGLTRLNENEVNSTMLKLDQLFADAKEESIRKAKRKKFRNKAAYYDYVERHGNVVGMTGIAGIGKTTAIIQTLNEVANGLPADERDHLFFKYLKNLDRNKELGVLEFLSVNPNWKHKKEIDDQILERLSKSNKLFIFLDGLDEPRFKDLGLDAPVIGLYDRATPMVILQNLLRGDILANAHKLLTSRPGAFLKLHPSCKPHFVVKVIGFNERSQDLYFRQICPQQEDYEKVTKSLGQNPHAKALCFLPIFAKTVAPYIIKHGTKDGTFTLTDVFAAFVSDCIHSPKFKEDPRVLRKLSDLALHGMLNDKITFDEEDFDKVGLDAEGMEDFLNMQVFSSDLNLRILEGDKVFFFLHLLWQEFFTSLKLLFQTDLATFSGLLESMESNTWEMVLRFLFGLLNTGLHQKLKPIFKICSTDVACKKSLLNGLVDSLGSQLLSNDGESSNSCLFKLCSLAQESNDKEITAKVADFLPKKFRIRPGTILPSEVSSLCHVLQATDRELVVNIGDIGYSLLPFTGNGLTILMETIMRTCHKTDFVSVALNGTHDFTTLSTCVHKINHLVLNNTRDADLSGFEVLTTAISRRETTMEKFLMGQLGSRELSCLAASAHNINKLKLWDCDTTGWNLQPLTDVISQRTHPMEVLHLYNCKLDSRGLSCLATSVHNTKQLELINCQIVGSDLQPLTDAISRMDRPLENLNLIRNTLGSRGVSCLATSVHNINKLELLDCRIVGSDLPPLTDAISRMDRPLEKLNLIRNPLESRGVSCLAPSVHNINQLELRDCKIAGSDLQPITDAISQLDRPMKKLNVSYNKLGSQGLAFLRTCAHNVQELEVNGCDIDETDVVSLRKLYQEKQATDKAKSKPEPEASQSQEKYTEQDSDDGTDHGVGSLLQQESTERSTQGSSERSTQMSSRESTERSHQGSTEGVRRSVADLTKLFEQI